MLFPDCSYDGNQGVRLQRGDFVDMGLVKKGTKLDLLVVPNGAGGGLGGHYYRLYTTSSLSDDQRQHYVGFWIEDTPLLLFGAEDLLGGGDNDFEDVMVVLDFGLDYDPPKTYYVSTRGNDSNSGLTPNTPFQTITKAAKVVRPGDTVNVAGGTYTENPDFRVAGTDLHAIRFIANGDVVVQSASDNAWLMTMYYADYYIFDGFHFTGRNVSAGVQSYGVYNYHSDVTFRNCEFDSLYYGVHGVYSGTKIERSRIHDNQGYAALNYYGGLDIKSCEIKNNANGPYSYREHYFSLTDSVIADNKGWALLYAFDPYGTHQPLGVNAPTVSNCTIQNNAYGLYLAFGKGQDRINFSRATFQGTQSWEMSLTQCDYDIDPRWRAQWPIEKSGTYGLLTWQSKLDVSDMTFEGYTGQAFYSRYDELTMKNCISRNNYRGLDIYYPKDGKLNDIQVVNNTGWGMHVYTNGEYHASLTNCKIENNANGVYFNGATEDNLKLVNTTIANNPGQGVQFYQADAELSPRTMGTRWKLSNNGYGVVSYYSKMRLEDITISGCASWAAVLHYGEATVRNCNFTGNGNGLYVYHNKSDEISNCHMDDNTTHGLAVAANGTYYGYDADAEPPAWRWMDTPNVTQVRNCTMDRNGYGLHLNRMLQDKIRITDSPIRDNRSAGLYVASSEFAFNPTVMQRLFQMSGNNSLIYASYGQYSFEDLKLADAKGYGVHTWYSDVKMRNCDFVRNGSLGYYSYYDRTLDAKHCNFQENNSYGMYVYSNGTHYSSTAGAWQDNPRESHRFVDCDISKNANGVYLAYTKDDTVQFVNSPIHDNRGTGLNAQYGDMSFNTKTMAANWNLSNNSGWQIAVAYGKYDFRDLEFSDTTYGVIAHYSDVTVKNCKFLRNAYAGFQSYYNKSFDMRDSLLSENGSYGMLLYHGKYYGPDTGDGLGWAWRKTDSVATIVNTPIEKSKSYGVYVVDANDNNLAFVNSPIRGNGSAGVYANGCTLTFSPKTLGDNWLLSDNGSHIYACWGKYLFEDLELTGAPSYGAATWGSDVTVRNCKFNENGSYGFHSHYDTLLVENSEFRNNKWAGITLRNTHPDATIGGPLTIRNSKIDGNVIGIYLPNCRTDVNPITLENTPISNNRDWGAYFGSSEIDFKPGTFVMDWKLTDNGNNFLIYYGKTRFENVTMSDAKGWLAYTAYGDVVAKNSTFTGNGNALYLHANSQSIIENCKVTDNTSWGIWTRPYYGYDTTDAEGHVSRVEYKGPVKLTNVESLRNGNGLGVYDYTVGRDSIELTDVTIADNTSWGIQFTYLKGELNQETFGQFDRALKQNGNGIYFNTVDADLVGLTISGNTGWGGHSVYSNLRIKDCSFSGNGQGFYWYAGWDQPYMLDLTLAVDNCHFDNNATGQGLLTYWGKASVKNSTFNNNVNGFYTAYDVRADVENCEMKGNRGWGVVLHVNYADWSTSWLDDRKSWYQDNVQTLKNCVIDGNFQGLHVYNAKNENFAMTNVQITNNHYPDGNGLPVGQGLYLTECRYTWDSQQADNVVIRGNGYGIGLYGEVQGEYTLKNVHAEDCGRHGLIVANSKARVENCTFTGPIYGLYWSRPKLVDVVNCRFEADAQNTGWAAHGYGGPVANDPGVVKITNSIFNNYYNGLYTYVYGDEAYTPEITAFNNTFANLANVGVYANIKSSPVVRNNIFAHKPGTPSGYGLGRNTAENANVIHSHNLLSGFSTPLTSGLTDPNDTTLVKEPRFQDEANGDFRLAKGSPAINSGTDLSVHVPYDMEGQVRPSFKVFEIGAYEYTSSNGAFRIVDWTEKK